MDVERTMEFILAQQAQFAADIQALKEVQAANQDNLGGLIEVVKALAQLQENLATEASNRLDQLSNTVRETNAETNNRLAQLSDTVRETNAETNNRLNTLIAVVERHIAGHN
jgi:hypothetical protein